MSKEQTTRRLVQFVREVSFDKLDVDVVHSAKRVILDTIGCAIGGHATRSGQILRRVKAARGGAKEASVVGTGERTSMSSAAYINAALANVLDADETLFMIGHHANCVVAASLAASEVVGASGQDMVAAVAVGYDLAARIGVSLDTRQEPGSGVEFAPLAGLGWSIFGSAAAASKLLNLSEDEIMSTFGIAGACAPIPYLGRWERTAPDNRPMTKYAFYGPMAENGVMAALLAKEGFLGDRDILDGEAGFWRLCGARGWIKSFPIAGLGERWWIRDAAFKAFPGCRHVSIFVDLFRQIVEEKALGLAEIDSVILRTNPVLLERRLDALPLNEVDMLFSAPYLVAVAAVEKFRVNSSWLDPGWLRDDRVKRLAGKIRLMEHPQTASVLKEQIAQGGMYRRVPSEVEVWARREKFVAYGEYARGDPYAMESRMSDQDLAEKFAGLATACLGSTKAKRAIGQIMSLETLDSVNDLVESIII